MVRINSFKEIRIENTNSCGYRCVMCPRDRQTRPIGFMTLEDFSLILDKIGPFAGSVHLHGYGEPLLDRHLIEKVRRLKKISPNCRSLFISTLGVKVADRFFTDLARAGLDYIVISLYGFTPESYQKIHGVDQLSRVKHNLQLLSDAMKLSPLKAGIQVPGEAITRLPVDLTERNAFCEWASKLGFDVGEWPYVHNYGDGRGYNPPKQDVMCPVINGHRRHVLHITWDLDVVPCCYDFNATIRFGHLRHQSLDEIFSSREYLNFYLAHQTGSLSAYPVCQNCEKIDCS